MPRTGTSFSDKEIVLLADLLDLISKEAEAEKSTKAFTSIPKLRAIVSTEEFRLISKKVCSAVIRFKQLKNDQDYIFYE